MATSFRVSDKHLLKTGVVGGKNLPLECSGCVQPANGCVLTRFECRCRILGYNSSHFLCESLLDFFSHLQPFGIVHTWHPAGVNALPTLYYRGKRHVQTLRTMSSGLSVPLLFLCRCSLRPRLIFEFRELRTIPWQLLSRIRSCGFVSIGLKL